MRLPQTLRGCTTLPHVGAHPGLPILAALIAATAFAGATRGGLAGALLGAAFMAATMGMVVLCGAHGRARLSDNLVRAARVKEVLQAWADTHVEKPRPHIHSEDGRPWRVCIMPAKQAKHWMGNPENPVHVYKDNGPIVPIPAALPHLVAQALTVDGRFAIPQSLHTITITPNTTLSAHARLKAHALLAQHDTGRTP